MNHSGASNSIGTVVSGAEMKTIFFGTASKRQHSFRLQLEGSDGRSHVMHRYFTCRFSIDLMIFGRLPALQSDNEAGTWIEAFAGKRSLE